MITLQALSELYETFTTALFAAGKDESDTDPMAPFLGPDNTEPHDYAWVQREFGWDDTH